MTDASPDTRYVRQSILPEIGARGQARLAGAHVVVVGCGALGSLQAELLARAGVGRLTLLDRDFVEPGNPSHIAQTLRCLLDRSDKRLRLGTAAREMFVHRLHRSKVMAGLDSVYQRVLNGRGS